jgi:hypothetical protein
MRVKIVLLFVATLGSTALIASAQQPAYVIRSDDPVVHQETGKGAQLIVPDQQALAPPGADRLIVPDQRALRPPGADRRNAAYMFQGNQGPRSFWAVTGEASGLSSQAEQLAQQLAAAKSDSDRDKIKGQLAEILEKQFDERQKRHEEELKALETQVKKLKDLVDKRQENRRDIIRARLAQIEKEAQGLGW